ncbi:MAG: hypothetical protein IK085_05715, partial [Clostridia bacterium]|nr:hypothetical protein [Clostridia bacterium]
MKTSKRILSLLLSVIMVLGVCAIAPFTASAADGYLQVGWENINLESDGSYYDGNVEYEAATHTLTFDNFELEYAGICINAYELGFDLTIKGSAKLTRTDVGGSAVYADETNLIIDCESLS